LVDEEFIKQITKNEVASSDAVEEEFLKRIKLGAARVTWFPSQLSTRPAFGVGRHG